MDLSTLNIGGDWLEERDKVKSLAMLVGVSKKVLYDFLYVLAITIRTD